MKRLKKHYNDFMYIGYIKRSVKLDMPKDIAKKYIMHAGGHPAFVLKTKNPNITAILRCTANSNYISPTTKHITTRPLTYNKSVNHIITNKTLFLNNTQMHEVEIKKLKNKSNFIESSKEIIMNETKRGDGISIQGIVYNESTKGWEETNLKDIELNQNVYDEEWYE